jgi:hypothetical protein
MIRDADERLRSSCRLACFTDDRPEPLSSHAWYGNGPLRARMWAQYGDNHAGVCLCFHRARLLEATIRLATARSLQLFQGPVTYRDGLPLPSETTATELLRSRLEQDAASYIEELLDQHVHEFFFVKNWDWASETEYRILVRGDTREHEFLDIADALEAIVLGPRFPPAEELTIIELCKRLDIPAHRLHWRNGRASVLPGPWPVQSQ